jgi:hypothetical protein
MKLPDAPEPMELKQEAKLFSRQHPGMNSDSLYIWLGRSLPSYLWKKCEWGEVLKREGISWQKFERIISLGNFKWWVRGQRDWDELISNVTKLVTSKNKLV